MGLHNLSAPKGATSKRKRVGRGVGSGLGKTCGRGSNGQRSRSGHRIGRGFEGGQMPLQRRMPKRGFENFARTNYALIHLYDLEVFESGTVVDTAALQKAGLIQRFSMPVKILSDGEIKKALVVRVQGYSQKAKEKIEAAGGKAEIVALHHSTKNPAPQEG
jgi:large subunit ribosomal protein L15